MAKAKVVKPKPRPTMVYLSLTEGEADLILALAARVGGDPVRSPRKYANRIGKALTEALGYGWEDTDAQKLLGPHLFFRDYSSLER